MAALIIPNSHVVIKNVGINYTRSGIVDVVKRMGGNIEILNETTISNEKTGDLKIKYSKLKGTEISKDIIPRLIDEIPIIAVLASLAKGTTIIKDAQDLRNKESDRIKTVATELKKIGANIEETPDGLIIEGKKSLNGNAEINTYHDHRLAMSFYIAGLICEKEIAIKDFINTIIEEVLNSEGPCICEVIVNPNQNFEQGEGYQFRLDLRECRRAGIKGARF